MRRNIDMEAFSYAETQNRFQNEIINGLKDNPKHLLSKYFYDKKGDDLFQQIMNMPEYYLTNCELEIFTEKTDKLAKAIRAFEEPFDLIELGAGDATKSSFLLDFLVKQNADFTYMPIDISGNIIALLQDNLTVKIPDLNIVGLNGEYFEMLDKANEISSKRKVILFLGSNIGNMEIEEAHHFCSELRQKLNPGDILLIGFDLKKNPHTILNAYNDPTGITAAFNLNLLDRINNELDADFNTNNFQHYQNYDPLTGACRSYLISLKEQRVNIENEQIIFRENEAIYMEISQKYSLEDMNSMAVKNGFSPLQQISDSKNWFIDAIWKVV
ncbi:L-histidine N(alpha)-methyltransferase [Chryseobacterium ginsengisoli]|uniref:L-histidine N(Alpha)-methyltransferase n=1 Tax=Chryseobacterium ginsengisoli TaxID=363853 RepID=A0ABP9M748_9FLAO